jgi:hypothetical protein
MKLIRTALEKFGEFIVAVAQTRQEFVANQKTYTRY